QQVMAMNPYDFSELVGDLFRAKGYKRIFSHPKVAHLFHDMEMYQDDKKVFVSCKLLPNQQQVNQAYLVRLFLQMRNLNMDEGIFVTLSEFTPECYEFVANKSITLINGDTLLEELLKYSDL
ncbi:MAG: restriction endonuclease, partial [Turicibacter sp.]